MIPVTNDFITKNEEDLGKLYARMLRDIIYGDRKVILDPEHLSHGEIIISDHISLKINLSYNEPKVYVTLGHVPDLKGKSYEEISFFNARSFKFVDPMFLVILVEMLEGIAYFIKKYEG